jgi:hypothetical protein
MWRIVVGDIKHYAHVAPSAGDFLVYYAKVQPRVDGAFLVLEDAWQSPLVDEATGHIREPKTRSTFYIQDTAIRVTKE